MLASCDFVASWTEIVIVCFLMHLLLKVPIASIVLSAAVQEPLTRVIQDFMHSGYVEYSFFIGQPRYRDLFRTSSQWWAYHDCVTRYR